MFGRERKNRKLGGDLDDLLLQMKGLLKSSLEGRVGMHQRALNQPFLILKVRHQALKKRFKDSDFIKGWLNTSRHGWHQYPWYLLLRA